MINRLTGRMQDDSAPDNDVGADLCSACAARWQHDEPVQLGGLWRGGGEGPHTVLTGLRHAEGGAERQSALLRGHRLGTQEPLRSVSDSAQ